MRSYNLKLYLLAVFLTGIGSSEDQPVVIDIPGDVIIGGLFPVHERGETTENRCGIMNPQPGMQYLEAMLFALDEINNDPTILPNITLGTIIYDTCRSQTIASGRAKEFIKYTLFPHTGRGPLAGIIGPFSSGISIAVASFLAVFEIPQISYASTSVDLSNKDRYGYFFRTVPPDSFQAEALVDIVKHFDWNYVLTVNSYGNYGERGIEKFKQAAERSGVCVAGSKMIPQFPTDDDFDNIITYFLQKRNANVIVIFSTMTDSEGMLQAAKRNAVAKKRFIWLGSNGWSNRVSVTTGQEDVAEGSLTVNHMDGRVKRFEDYFINLDVKSNHTNRWFAEYWQYVLNCKLENHKVPRYMNEAQVKPCGNKNLTSVQLEWAPVRVVINAVYAMANGVDALRKEICPNTTGMCTAMRELSRVQLHKKLKNVTFRDAAFDFTLKFNKNQEMEGNYTLLNFKRINNVYKYENVGNWAGILQDDDVITGKLALNAEQIKWKNNSEVTPVSVCSYQCSFGEIRKPSTTLPAMCCWDCNACAETDILVNNTCVKCSQGHLPGIHLKNCEKLPVRYIRWSDTMALVFSIFASFGIVLTLIIIGFFIKFNDHSIVKASGRELCYILFTGIILSYLSIFVYLTKPSTIKCALERFTAVSYVTCFAPIFMKTNRIYRIFKAAGTQVTRPSLISPRSQVFISFSIVTVQVLLGALWLISAEPNALEVYPSIHEVELICQMNTYSLAINFSFSVILMVLCTTFAFKTRNCPRNFNEAKYIGLTMYFTCSVWIVYIPTYLNTKNGVNEQYLTCGVNSLVSTFILLVLFMPKIQMILSKSPIHSSEGVTTVNNHPEKGKQMFLSKQTAKVGNSMLDYQNSLGKQQNNEISHYSIQNGNSTTEHISVPNVAFQNREVTSLTILPQGEMIPSEVDSVVDFVKPESYDSVIVNRGKSDQRYSQDETPPSITLRVPGEIN